MSRPHRCLCSLGRIGDAAGGGPRVSRETSMRLCVLRRYQEDQQAQRTLQNLVVGGFEVSRETRECASQRASIGRRHRGRIGRFSVQRRNRIIISIREVSRETGSRMAVVVATPTGTVKHGAEIGTVVLPRFHVKQSDQAL